MTTTPDAPIRRKLIEVSIPLEDINAESAREKSIRHGHPSTLHLWWARRPLAAARAVLFAQLVDDPSSNPGLTEEQQRAERERLHGIIRRLVKWENINDESLLREANQEILKSTGGNPPTILDPFAGGGTIPLEAQRLGLKAYASDLNPVAVLINKALIEIPPKSRGGRPCSQAPPRPSLARGHAPPDLPRTCGDTARGCASRPKTGLDTSTPMQRSSTTRPAENRQQQRSRGSGLGLLPAPTRPAGSRCR